MDFICSCNGNAYFGRWILLLYLKKYLDIFKQEKQYLTVEFCDLTFAYCAAKDTYTLF